MSSYCSTTYTWSYCICVYIIWQAHEIIALFWDLLFVAMQKQRAAASQAATTKRGSGTVLSLSELAGHNLSPRMASLLEPRPELRRLYHCLPAYLHLGQEAADNPFALVALICGYQVSMPT